jgi:hypothetical protein
VFANAYRAIWSDQGFDRRSFSRHKVDLDKVVEKEWNRHSRKIDPQGRRVKSESRAEEIEEGIILPDDQVGENRS